MMRNVFFLNLLFQNNGMYDRVNIFKQLLFHLKYKYNLLVRLVKDDIDLLSFPIMQFEFVIFQNLVIVKFTEIQIPLENK